MSKSNDAVLTQAAHTLTLIGQQRPTVDEQERVHLYLPALVQAVKRGSIPPLADFRRAVGLGILEFAYTFPLPAQPTLITSREYFEEAGVGFMGDEFQDQFIGLEVPATEAAELAVHTLIQSSTSGPIITELGGEKRAVLFASQFKEFLSKNKRSKGWFVFYLRGKDGNSRAVGADWDAGDGDWGVDAYSSSFPDGWGEGGRVVSRK